MIDQAKVLEALEDAALDEVQAGFKTMHAKIAGSEEGENALAEFRIDLSEIKASLELAREAAIKVFK